MITSFPMANFASGAAPAFSPIGLAGCVLWLDASDASTVTLASGLVSQWSDKSGVGNHASQPTSDLQPSYATAAINGLNCIQFPAAGSTYLLPNANPILGASAATLFFVAQRDSSYSDADGYGSPVEMFGDSGDTDHFPYSNNNIYLGYGSTTRQGPITVGESVLNSPHVFSCESGPGLWNLTLDATTLLATSTNTFGANAGGPSSQAAGNGPYYGARPTTTFAWYGYLLEILMYDRLLTGGEYAQVYSYLATRSGI